MALSEDVLTVIRDELSKLCVPGSHDKCYKDECLVSFDSPYSEGGLYVNMATLMGYGAAYWQADRAKTDSRLYLHEQWVQALKPKLENVDESKAEPTKLAIGTSGGFNAFDSPYETDKVHSLCVSVPGRDSPVMIPLPCQDLPELVNNVIDGVIAHDGMKNKMQVDTWSADSEIKESKYATRLVQLDNGKKISADPSTWVCEMSGDKDNLWLNLSTGHIGGGRKNWDGSGGSGAALIHFEETGKQYPLCVKLGTITAHGADIWSYAPDEDTLVTDPKLAEHLSHWGIDIQRLEKTDTTMAELEVKLNMKYDWAKIMENGADLTPLAGPGCVGLRNIGSSCYLNSVMQSLLAISEVQERYLANRSAILESAPANPAEDFAVQMSKIAHACLTDTYCAPLPEGQVKMPEGEADTEGGTLERHVVAPRMLKQLVGKNHPEFSGGRQQDAAEYFQYFLEQMTRAEKTALTRFMPADAQTTSSLFEFHTQNKMKCSITNEVRLPGPETSNMLDFRVPISAAVNKDAVEAYEQEAKKAKIEESAPNATAKRGQVDAPKLDIPFSACLDTYFEDQTIDVANPSLGGQSAPCVSNTRFRSFPKYLMVKLNRYTLGSNWVPVKIDASVNVPEILDLTSYSRSGLSVGETPMPEAAASDSSAGAGAGAGDVAPDADPNIVMQLVSMGFSENGSKRATLATNNSDVDTAMAWVFAHMEDSDFNDPPSAAAAVTMDTGPAPAASVSQDSIDMLVNYGFSAVQCEVALKSTDGNIERAADWLFSHDNVAGITAETLAALDADATATATAVASSSAASAVPELGEAGNGKYELMSMISHIGTSTDHGHYVCHRRLADGRWALYNDEKVAVSTKPPIEHAYMYLFRKV